MRCLGGGSELSVYPELCCGFHLIAVRFVSDGRSGLRDIRTEIAEKRRGAIFLIQFHLLFLFSGRERREGRRAGGHVAGRSSHVARDDFARTARGFEPSTHLSWVWLGQL